MKLGAKIFGALSGVLLLYLLLGIMLPGTWEADSEIFLPAPPAEVFPYLNRSDLWLAWNPMPESGMERSGPEEGAGATLRWDDPQYGKGEFRVLSSIPDQSVDYEVEIEGGALRILGRLNLEPYGNGTTLRWNEKGDFGWNPLMGYAARGMGESQGEAMRSSLTTLEELVSGGPLSEGPPLPTLP